MLKVQINICLMSFQLSLIKFEPNTIFFLSFEILHDINKSLHPCYKK